MSNETYEFDVQANSQSALEALSKISGLMDHIDSVSRKINSSGGMVSGDNLGAILKQYQEINKTVNNIRDATQRATSIDPNGSRAISGMKDNVSALSKELDNASRKIEGLSRGGVTNSSSLKSFKEDVMASGAGIDSILQKLNSVRDATRSIRSVASSQENISRRAMDNQQMPYSSYRRYVSNYTQAQTFGQQRNTAVQDVNQYSSLREDFIKLRDSMRSPSESRGVDSQTRQKNINYSQMEIDNLDKLIKAQQEYISTIDSSTEKINNTQDRMTQSGSSIRVSPSPNDPVAFSNRMLTYMGQKVAGQAIGSVRSSWNTGAEINRQTGEQALNISNISGGQGSVAVRKGIQDTSQNNQTGFTTEQALQFYNIAMNRSGYQANNSEELKRNTRDMNAMEQGARYSGVSADTYKSFMSAATSTSGAFTDHDITRLGELIAGENVRSGNAGNADQNTQTITNLLTQIAQTRSLTTSQERNLVTTTGSLSKLGRDFQGQTGQNNLSTMNSAITGAASGQNNQLLMATIQSNPSRYGGGINGYVKAQEDLSQGLARPDNLAGVRNMVSKLTASGQTGAANLLVQNTLGLQAPAAAELVKGMQNGKLSNAELAEEAKKDQEAGNKQYSNNESNYNSDYQKQLNYNKAIKDYNKSRVNQSKPGQAVTGVQNTVNSTNPWVALGIGALGQAGGDLLYRAAGKGVSSLFRAVLPKITGKSSQGGTFSKMISKIFPSADASSEVKGAAESASKDGNWFTRGIKGVGSGAEKLAKGAGDVASDVAKGVGKDAGGLGGLLKGGSKILGKVATPLAALSSVYDIVTAKDKVREATKQAGGWAGSLSGGSAGAAAGTAILPGAGTVIGGIAGSISGYFGGDWFGGKVNDWFTGRTNGKKKKSSSSTSREKESSANSQKSYLTAEQNVQALKYESRNISRRENYISEWKKLMEQEKNGSVSSRKPSSHNATSGIINGETTEVAEMGHPEFVLSTEASNSRRNQSLLNMYAETTGLRAKPPVSALTNVRGNTNNSSTFAPNINVNITGTGNTSEDGNAVGEAILSRLKESQYNFKNQVKYS